MRVLLSGNSPFVGSGYGIQTAQLAMQLKQLGHEVGIFAYFGLAGGRIEWNGIPVYGNPAPDYGQKWVEQIYDHFKADCLITLVDVWIMGEQSAKPKWFPWCPVDHEPMPPNVFKILSTHAGIQKPIAMSRYGEREMKRMGLDCFYVPHMINCEVFKPDAEIREAHRSNLGWSDKFVIGQVGTNVRERKNWTASFLALSKFRRNHDDVIMYCHTDYTETRGRDLAALRKLLMIDDITRFPSMTELKAIGISDVTMNNMYNSLDVYLQPSKGEGFGIPIIEAQSCGTPVIVSNNTAQPELCGGGWILKDMRPQFDEQSSWEGDANPDEIVEYLEQAYQEKKSGKIEERRKAAREKAIEYDIDVVMGKYWVPVLAEIEDMVKHPQKALYRKLSRIEDKKWEDNARPNFDADVWYNRNRNEITLKMLKPYSHNDRVLSIGARGWAEGELLNTLSGNGCKEIVATDLIGGENILEADICSMPFEDKTFDMVLCREVIEHIENDRGALSEISRVLKDGGYLFITTPNIGEGRTSNLEHFRVYSPGSFQNMIEDASFRIIDKRGNVPHILSGLLTCPELLPTFQSQAYGFDEKQESYEIGTQMFVLAQKE